MQNLSSFESLLFFEDGPTRMDLESIDMAERDRFLSNGVSPKPAMAATVMGAASGQ